MTSEARVAQLESQLDDLRSLVTTRLFGTNKSSNYNPFSNDPIYDYKLISQAVRVYNAVWTDNSPGAGQVAWAGATVTYLGNTYTITNGNTAVGNIYIYWQASNPFVFQAATAPPTLGDNDFLIALSNGGVHSLVWNKSAVIDTVNLIDSVFGYVIQPPPATTITNPVLPVAAPATLTYTLLNSTGGKRILISVRVRADTPFTINEAGTAIPAIDFYLKLTIDGGTPQQFRFIRQFPATAGAAYGPDQFDDEFRTFEASALGNGLTAGDFSTALFNISALTSLKVELIITCSDTTGTILAGRTITGQIKATVGYAVKV